MRSFFSFFLIIYVCSGISSGAEKTRLYRTSNEIMYFRATEIIYSITLTMDGGKKKSASTGNTFAKIVLNFANLTDQPMKGYGMNPVKIYICPKNVLLLSDSGKAYSGLSATKFLSSGNKPFLKEKMLNPGEDMVAAMCFHIPKKAKILGVMYKIANGRPLIIDYAENPQP